jgi:hypothetical protein
MKDLNRIASNPGFHSAPPLHNKKRGHPAETAGCRVSFSHSVDE